MSGESWPLTEAQEGIWYAQAQAPGRATFNTGQVLWIDGALDLPALARAVAHLCGEAESLRLRFGLRAGRPVQWFGAAPALGRRDLSGASRAEAEAAIREDAFTRMDLAAGPVADLTLWRLGETRHALSQRIHHLAADGYANTLITRRIAALYAHYVAGAPAPRPLAPWQAALDADAAYRAAPGRAGDRDWWHARLDGLGTVGSLAPGRAAASERFLRAEHASDPDLPAALRALAERAGISWADALTALTAAYCARLTEGESVPGIPLMNRMGGGVGSVPSTQVNVLPFRHPVDEAAPLAEWLAGAAAALGEMRRHGRYRGEHLRRELGLVGGARRLHGPLINVLPFEPTPRMPGLETRLEILGAGSVDDITFAFRGDGRGPLRLQVDANPALYSRAGAEAHLNRLTAFLTRACGTERLADLPTLTEAETRTHVTLRNATAHPVPETTLSALIEAQMAASPEATALVFGGEATDYATLDRRSAALAARLRALGAGPGTRVAVALPRSTELLVALVAVLRVGAAFVPLDPEDASARRADMLDRAAPVLVLAEPGFPAETVLPPDDWPAQGAAPGGTAPEDPAYVLFTSGSTGRPKGVSVPHRAIVNRLLWMRAQYGIGARDRILQKTPATFDVSVWEFFLPLISGATLVIAPPGAHRDPRAIAGLIRDHGVTAVHFVPSMLALFADTPEARGLAIRHVFASGEALPVALARRCLERMRIRLHNLYGPTEAAVDVTFHEASGEEEGASVPIGRPVWNTGCYVLDEWQRPVPDGVAGRLFLTGRQLADGYLGQPELTAERFLPDPFVPGGRMYDTGDIVRAASDGTITFEGRADGQVKIRGVRIETGEVEAALLDTGLLRQAVVMAREGAGGARLIAWVVPRDGTEALGAALAARLPAAMIPAVIVPLEALPLTPNGKLDRGALPEPRAEAAAGRAPAPGTEALLARLYAELLGEATAIGPETDFFLAGGDSLRAVRLTLRIEEETGRAPGLAAIFETPVLADLARRLAEDAPGGDGLGPVLRLSRGSRPPLFAIHPAGGIGWCYRGLAAALEDRPLIALQSPLLDAAAPDPATLDELARGYAARIAELAPEGPLHLAGWSLGGLIAQAAACHLERQGRVCGMVALLDSYPSECWRNEPEPGPDAALRALLAIAGHDPEAHPELTDRAAILGFLRARGEPLAQLPERALDGVIRSVQQTNRLVRGHREACFGGPLLHVRAARDHAGTALRPELWRPYAARLETLSLPCLHGELLSARVRPALAGGLMRAMAQGERAASAAAP